MVIIHVANIDTALLGGVQIAVPNMVRAQSQYATVGMVNTHGDTIDGVQMLPFDGGWDIDRYPAPFCRPDLVVFHELYRFEFIRMYRLLTQRNIPYVIVPHGCFSIEAQHKKRLKKMVANLLFFGRFMRHARCIQYLSDHEQGLSAFARRPAFVSGSGVTLPQEHKTTFPHEGVRFVYIGRLEMYIKGLDLLLEAVKQSEGWMRRRGATVEIYGPNYDGAHDALNQMIDRLQIGDLVRVDKEKTGDEKREILLSADCFIQTSRTEGLPLGPLEALAYGLPCIVTRGVGLGGRIEAYGAGYQSDNTAEDIARQLCRFADAAHQAAEMSRSAVRLIEEIYDIHVIAKATVERYGDLLR